MQNLDQFANNINQTFLALRPALVNGVANYAATRLSLTTITIQIFRIVKDRAIDMIEDEWIKRRKKWARRILRPFTGIDSIKASDPMILAAFLVDVEALLVAITDLDQHTQFQNLLAQVPQGEAIWLAFRQALWRGYCLLVFRVHDQGLYGQHFPDHLLLDYGLDIQAWLHNPPPGW